jgi:hypothetical protein
VRPDGRAPPLRRLSYPDGLSATHPMTAMTDDLATLRLPKR